MIQVSDGSPPIRLQPRPKFRARAFFWRWVRDAIVGVTELALYLVMRALPTDAVSSFGAAIVRITRLAYSDSERRARAAWARLRPEAADTGSVDAAMDRLWRCVSRTMTEFAVLDRLWREGRVEIEGLTNIDLALADGRPIIVAALHLGNWEVIAVAGLALGYAGNGIYLPPDNWFEHWIVRDARIRLGAEMVAAGSNSLRAAVRTLRERRKPFVIFVDDLVRDRVQAPAFGRLLRPEGNIAYVARLAAMTGAAVIPAYCVRRGDAARFRVVVMPPVELGAAGRAGLLENIGRIDAAIAPVVRDHLDQWFYLFDLELDD